MEFIGDKVKEYISKEKIKERLKELGKEITKDYQNEEIVVICLLKGAFVFCSDLIRFIDRPIQLDFMTLSSYGEGTESSGQIHFRYEGHLDLKDKHVLIVEDIVDTGLTLKSLLMRFHDKGVRSVKVACLLSKPAKREHKIPVDYLGFEIADHFVVGYGLDYAENFRHLPYIGEMTN